MALSKIHEFSAHESCTTAIAVGKKSHQVLATGGEDGKIHIWRIGNSNNLMKFPGHRTAIRSLAFDRRENFVAAGAESGTIKVYDLAEQAVICSLHGHKTAVNSLDNLPRSDRYILVSGADDTVVKLWDARAKNCINSYLGHEGPVSSVRFTPNGVYVISASADKTICVWDVRAGRKLSQLRGHLNSVQCIDIHPSELQFTTAGTDRAARVWSLETYENIYQSSPCHGEVQAVQYSVDGQYVAAFARRGYIVSALPGAGDARPHTERPATHHRAGSGSNIATKLPRVSGAEVGWDQVHCACTVTVAPRVPGPIRPGVSHPGGSAAGGHGDEDGEGVAERMLVFTSQQSNVAVWELNLQTAIEEAAAYAASKEKAREERAAAAARAAEEAETSTVGTGGGRGSGNLDDDSFDDDEDRRARQTPRGGQGVRRGLSGLQGRSVSHESSTSGDSRSPRPKSGRRAVTSSNGRPRRSTRPPTPDAMRRQHHDSGDAVVPNHLSDGAHAKRHSSGKHAGPGSESPRTPRTPRAGSERPRSSSRVRPASGGPSRQTAVSSAPPVAPPAAPAAPARRSGGLPPPGAVGVAIMPSHRTEPIGLDFGPFLPTWASETAWNSGRSLTDFQSYAQAEHLNFVNTMKQRHKSLLSMQEQWRRKAYDGLVMQLAMSRDKSLAADFTRSLLLDGTGQLKGDVSLAASGKMLTCVISLVSSATDDHRVLGLRTIQGVLKNFADLIVTTRASVRASRRDHKALGVDLAVEDRVERCDAAFAALQAAKGSLEAAYSDKVIRFRRGELTAMDARLAADVMDRLDRFLAKAR